jgi:hypothetical protein
MGSIFVVNQLFEKPEIGPLENFRYMACHGLSLYFVMYIVIRNTERTGIALN